MPGAAYHRASKSRQRNTAATRARRLRFRPFGCESKQYRMTILLYDVLQALAKIPARIKSPALADRWQPPTASSAADVVLDVSSVATPMDALGIAAHGATTVTIWQGTNKQQIAYEGAGLYPIAQLAAQPLHVQVRNAKNQNSADSTAGLGPGPAYWH